MFTATHLAKNRVFLYFSVYKLHTLLLFRHSIRPCIVTVITVEKFLCSKQLMVQHVYYSAMLVEACKSNLMVKLTSADSHIAL